VLCLKKVKDISASTVTEADIKILSSTAQVGPLQEY
jgi:hypothetical protein